MATASKEDVKEVTLEAGGPKPKKKRAQEPSGKQVQRSGRTLKTMGGTGGAAAAARLDGIDSPKAAASATTARLRSS